MIHKNQLLTPILTEQSWALALKVDEGDEHEQKNEQEVAYERLCLSLSLNKA